MNNCFVNCVNNKDGYCVGIPCKRDVIIAVIGPSGSGKTGLVEQLDKEVNVIQSYTTRPARYKGEWGHIFIDMIEAKDIMTNENVIAYKQFGSYEYFALEEQYQGKGVTLYVIDPKGLEILKRRVKDAKIITVYINTDAQTRYRRLFETIAWPFYQLEMLKQYYAANKEIRQRIDRDVNDFKLVEADYIIDNNQSKLEALQSLRRVIEKYKG